MPPTENLWLNEIASIFDQLPRLDAVRLTGGEPFLRKDLGEIARLAQGKLRPILLHITTNGLLTDRIVRFCEDRDKRILLQLLISIDGVGAKHNRVRGIPSAWTRVMETIRALAPRQRALHVRLGVNQTIVDAEGAEHYRRLRELLRPHGVLNNAVMAYEASATYNVERGIDVTPRSIGEFNTFGKLGDECLPKLLDAVQRDLKELPWHERIAKRYYWQGIRNRLLANEGKPNPKCVALNSHLRILPNGDVPTCQFNGKTLGNLREQSFHEIWRSEKAAHLRRWVRRCPGCWAECEVLPNAVYTLDVLRAAFSSSRHRTARNLGANE
jgi:MoaA/NifB/PqqE/SkfB family radical SAM enzyme